MGERGYEQVEDENMDLIEISEESKMEREQVADLLHKLADSLARHNSVDFEHNGFKFHIDVPKDVSLKIETEIEDDKSSIELEISW